MIFAYFAVQEIEAERGEIREMWSQDLKPGICLQSPRPHGQNVVEASEALIKAQVCHSN